MPSAPKVLIVSADRSLPTGIPHNIGDSFLTEALAQALRSRGVEPLVADFGLDSDQAVEGRVGLLGSRFRGLARAIGSTNGVIVGGGTLLQDDMPDGPAYGGLARLLAVSSVVAAFRGRPVSYFGVGSNPVDRQLQRFLLRIAMLGRSIWARDRWTHDLLKSSFGKNSQIAADAALLSRRLPRSNGDADHAGILLAGYPQDAAALTPEVVNQLRRQHGRVSFISMSQGPQGDSTYLTAETRDALDDVHESLSTADAIVVFRGYASIASSRMHALYLGLLSDTPLVSLSDRNKVQSFRDEFGVLKAASWEDVAHVEMRRCDESAIRIAMERAQSSLNDFLAKGIKK